MAVLQIAAASDLQPVAERLAESFAASTSLQRPKFVHGASGILASQIESGAPFDVFMSADSKIVEGLITSKRILKDTRFAYAAGSLSVWVAKAQPESQLKGAPFKLSTLREARFKRIAIANPDHAPYGRLAADALARAGVDKEVKPKLVFGSNVAHTVRYATSGEVDVALIATSFTKTQAGALAKYGVVLRLDDEAAPKMTQEGAIVAATKMRKDAEQFMVFLKSNAAQEIFRDAGFEITQK